MKSLALATALAALAAFGRGGTVARTPPRCPKVAVWCPDTARTGDSVTFNAVVGDAPADAKLAFNWVVSAGVITGGQGTSSVSVDTTGVGSARLTATAEVTGLPASCPGSSSCTTPVFGIGDTHDKQDEYGSIKFEEEKARLDNFAVELLNWPEGVGYVVAYGGRRSRRGEAVRRAERARRYLTTVRDIDPARVVTIDGGYREGLTVELRLRPKGMPPPEPRPTVDPGEVRFVEAGRARRARRR